MAGVVIADTGFSALGNGDTHLLGFAMNRVDDRVGSLPLEAVGVVGGISRQGRTSRQASIGSSTRISSPARYVWLLGANARISRSPGNTIRRSCWSPR